jgi:hypothetical protein
VHRCGHPESQGVRYRIARSCAHQFRAGPAGCNVLSQDREQPRRERRAEAFTPRDPFIECVEDELPLSIMI